MALSVAASGFSIIAGYRGNDNHPVQVNADSITATATFGTTNIKIGKSSVPFTDTNGIPWTCTTAGTTSFTPAPTYCQLGSSSKPATSITLVGTLSESAGVNVSSVSAKFGGFSGTVGTVSIKVDDTEVATGSLSGTTDVTVSGSTPTIGKTITISVTNISKGVKLYNLSYTYDTVTLESISAELKDSSKTWLSGNKITADDIVVTGHFSDGSSATITEGIELENATLASGENTVTVTAGGFSTTLTVSASERYITAVSVAGEMEQKNYYAGDSWNLSGLSLLVSYSTGNPETMAFGDDGVSYSISPETAASTDITALTITGNVQDVPFQTTIEGISVSANEYTQITKTETIYDGMEIIFGSGQTFANGTIPSGQAYLSKVDYSFKGYAPEDVASLRVKGTVGNWQFYIGESLLGATAAKKMAFDSTATAFVSTWRIDVNTETGDATVASTNDAYGRILYNATTPRFLNYTSATNESMLLPQIYAKAPANDIYAFIRDNMRMGDPALGGSGSGACSTEGYYAAAKAALAELSSEDRAAFEADANGLYTAALARYNAWAIANGDLTPFDGKATITSAANAFTAKEHRSSVWAVAGIASVGLIAGTSLIVLRKKKEN